MTPERWQQIDKLLEQALEQEPDRRSAFLDEACHGDAALRLEVESLLSAHGKAEGFTEAGPMRKPAMRKTTEDPGDLTGQQVGHYEILSRLGKGGMGIVYKARDQHLDRFVAIKVLPPELVADPDRKRRFAQEAKAASALNHPNIITIHDIASENGIDFIVMEYVQGKTLAQAIPRRGLKLNEVLKYATQIADALAKAHVAGIIHRDLKPGNIMVDEGGLVKVLDFGLAKLTERPQVGELESTDSMPPWTDEGTILGTAAYMSPEQAAGKPVDARSDIFSFGSVLYEMVTGQRVFQGDSKMSTLAAVLNQEPKPAIEISLSVPHDLEKIITRCLRKDPSRRFQHMADLKVALEELKEESDSGLLSVKEGTNPSGKPRKFSLLRWVTLAAGVSLAVAAWFWLGRSTTVQPEAVLTAVPLTTYAGHEHSPSLSPDGNQVTFSWNGERQTNFDIYVKLIGAGPPLRLTSHPDRRLESCLVSRRPMDRISSRFGAGESCRLASPADRGSRADAQRSAQTTIIDFSFSANLVSAG
jgi:serine/threonine protein kinase